MTRKIISDIVMTENLHKRKFKRKERLQMVKTNELKAQMKRMEITQKTLAKKMSMNPSTLNKKINNTDGSKLTVKEANKLANELHFPKTELATIFFAEELA